MLAIKEPAQCTYKTKDTEKIGKEFTTERRVVRDLPASSWITPLDLLFTDSKEHSSANVVAKSDLG